MSVFKYVLHPFMASEISSVVQDRFLSVLSKITLNSIKERRNGDTLNIAKVITVS